MSDFKVIFSASGWLLLLLIPAIAFVLFPYFRMAKKYRRNRNRITAIVLHLITLTLCIFLLSGMQFKYTVPNAGNEVLLVVDASYSTREEQEAKDEYIRDVIAVGDADVYKIGIVTFGYTQEYAVPLTDDFDSIFSTYQNAPTPDTSATDIAAALSYAKTLFTNPEAAKIVLLSDGIETDGKASSVAREISAAGIRIDTVCCQTLSPALEVQIVDCKLPDYHLAEEEKFDIELTLKNSYKEQSPVTVTMYDNGEQKSQTTVELQPGTQPVMLEHSLKNEGLHALRFEITDAQDTVVQNNTFYSYIYLEAFDNVLVIESVANQSDMLASVLRNEGGDSGYTVTVINVSDSDFPMTLDALRQYDEVILNNIANSDLPEGFDKVLQSYVYELGGGLFTVGGSEPDDQEKAHAYNREDMAGTLYQQMLPVQAINYTPPLGLALVIDISGSMGERLDAAKNSALSIVQDETCLTERDYCAIITLSDDYEQATSLLPMTRQDEIRDAIYDISSGGSTNFTPSIVRAGNVLRAAYLDGLIEKKHVVIITDGGASDYEQYLQAVKEYYTKDEITFSFVAVDAMDSSLIEQMETAAAAGGGHCLKSDIGDLTMKLKEDIRLPEIREVEYGEFQPKLNPDSYYATVINQEEMPALFGFYGTRARSSEQGVEIVLSGAYNVPIYAQWRYGKGLVGSFMCDLYGGWSAEFLADDSGRAFLRSVVNKLSPRENIRIKDIDFALGESDNYTTPLSIYHSDRLGAGESVRVTVKNMVNEQTQVQVVQPSASEGYSRASFVAFDPGVYEILVEHLNADGGVVYSGTVYKTFSYSLEYDILSEKIDSEEFMRALASKETGDETEIAGNASLLEDAEPYAVFIGFVDRLSRNFDPRILFMILAIVTFLLDIAVRKFKFKWPHELIREHREKKNRIE